MGFFRNVKELVSDVVEGAGEALGDVFESAGDAALGERGQRGSRIGETVAFLASDGDPAFTEFGRKFGQALSDDISEAPEIERERRARKQQTSDDAVLSENPFENTGEVITAGVPGPSRNEDFDTGTVIDIRYKNPVVETLVGTGMDIIEEVGDFFFGDDDAPTGTGMSNGMRMCPPSAPKAFNVNKTTGCVTITRRQQAKLREAVRMFGGAQVASNLGISNQLLQQLLLKTFRARRRGISGADIRAVKRVDRQMHSLAMALGGISSTSKAVVGRRSPTKR